MGLNWTVPGAGAGWNLGTRGTGPGDASSSASEADFGRRRPWERGRLTQESPLFNVRENAVPIKVVIAQEVDDGRRAEGRAGGPQAHHLQHIEPAALVQLLAIVVCRELVE
jgi:hypothetical protein